MAATETKAKRQRRTETTTYLVQQRPHDGATQAWFDSGEITVPAGTRRRTVFERVLAEVDLALKDGERVSLRVIPAEFAEPVPVAYEQPPAQLKVLA